MSNKVMRSARFKKLVLELAEGLGSDAKAYREFEVPRSTFYRRKKAFAAEGEAGLVRKKPVARSHPRQLSSVAVDCTSSDKVYKQPL